MATALMDRPITPPRNEPPDPEPAEDFSDTTRTVLMAAGRTLMAIGVLVLLFAAFQLWGTGFSEARAQAELTDRFAAQLQAQTVARPEPEAAGPEDPRLEDAATVGSTRTDPQPAPGAEPPAPLTVVIPDAEPPPAPTPVPPLVPPLLEVGEPIGILSIPAIGLTKTVAEGTSRDVLRSGPGHYPSTPLPGQPGNVAIAGHRTTHGAPFLDIDQLQPGHEITVETVDGVYRYTVDGYLDADGATVGHQIVRPEDVHVIADHGDDRLTLTACHPKYSARQRIIVTATLVSAPAPPPAPAPPSAAVAKPAAPPSEVAAPEPGPQVAVGAPQGAAPAPGAPAMAETLGWQMPYAWPTALWALFTGLIALAAWVVGRWWTPNPSYAMAVPPFTLSLYYCFVNLERLIPAV